MVMIKSGDIGLLVALKIKKDLKKNIGDNYVNI